MSQDVKETFSIIPNCFHAGKDLLGSVASWPALSVNSF